MALSTHSGTNLRIPTLCVHVSCFPGAANLATGSPAIGIPANSVFPNQVHVKLPADTILASVLHPTAASTFAASTQVDGLWTLAAQDVVLERSATHPLAIIVPGYRLKLLAGPSTGSIGYSHLVSFSVPLAQCFKDIRQNNMHTLNRATCEDGMVYTIKIGLDTRGLSVQEVQKAAADLETGVDVLMHHESMVAQALGMPGLKTVEELASEADAHKQRRVQAVSLVLTALCAGDDTAGMLDLQYGRAYGMRVDQQQCRVLREGAVLGHGFEQTLLNATIAQTGLLVKIAQSSGVDVHDVLGVQRAVQEFVHTQGADALAHGIYEHMQTIHNSRTTYGLDPSFGVGMSVTKTVQNIDGSLTMNVIPQVALKADPGEDQNLTPGTAYADVLGFMHTNGLMKRDCEDGCHNINAVGDLFRCVPGQHLLASQQQLLEHMPADVQLHANTLKFMSSEMIQNAAAVEASTTQALTRAKTPIGNVNSQRLAALRAKGPVTTRALYATSLLAGAPQLTSAIGSSNNDPAAKLQCSAKEYHAWWTGALREQSANLSGHSVALTAAMAPLLSTSVLDTRVDVHMLDENLRVFESTAPARQIEQADTSAVKLDLTKAAVTPARRSLQQRLNQCGPLTLCMACNVRSSLHAEETKAAVAQLLKPSANQQTGSSLQGAGSKDVLGPSIVPMQTFSLRAEASSQEELSRQMAFTFYKTLLACGAGLVFTLDSDGNNAFAGMSMSRRLPGTQAFIAGSPIEGIEQRNLRALGALQASFVLTAAEALASMPPLMPLAMQQRMRMCHTRKQLVPLTAAELKQAKHACGMLAQTAMLSVNDAGASQKNAFAAPTASTDRVAANMLALHNAASQVVGPDLHVTGGPFAETLVLTFA